MFKRIFTYINTLWLEASVFLTGACLMIIEIVGSRVVAPYMGTSTVVWTMLIGVILSFLSLGYYLGGIYADKHSSRKELSTIVILSSLFLLLILVSEKSILSFLVVRSSSFYYASLLITITILFSGPSFLLGVVSPYAAKLKIKSLKKTGGTIGSLYAISTMGSIMGTFVSGFVFIPYLGTNTTLSLIIIVLLITSCLIDFPYLGSKRMIVIICILLVLAYYVFVQAGDKKLIDRDTAYQRVTISEMVDASTKRTIRYLRTDPFAYQGKIFIDGDDLVAEYLKYYRLADLFTPSIEKGLVIGGGIYSYPRDFLKQHPFAKLDVVELDEGITRLAKQYFFLKENKRMNIFHEDGRVFLNVNSRKYDAIYIDAFNSISIPFQLTTKEAVRQIYRGLNNKGTVILNLISSFEGKNNKLLKAIYTTYASVFPQVYVFRVQDKDLKDPQNIILIAVKEKRDNIPKTNDMSLNTYLQRIWKKQIPRAPALIDDWAPVDYYTFSMM